MSSPLPILVGKNGFGPSDFTLEVYRTFAAAVGCMNLSDPVTYKVLADNAEFLYGWKLLFEVLPKEALDLPNLLLFMLSTTGACEIMFGGTRLFL